jgi:hypothetical protein
MRIGRTALLVVAGLGGTIYFANMNASNPKAPDASWIEDAEAKKQVTRVIRAEGGMCPAVKLIHFEGLEPDGYVFKVWCGPDRTNNVYDKLVYRVATRDPTKPSIGSIRVWR